MPRERKVLKRNSSRHELGVKSISIQSHRSRRVGNQPSEAKVLQYFKAHIDTQALRRRLCATWRHPLQQQQQRNNDNVKCNEAASILLLTCEIVMCETTVSHFLLLLLSAFFFMFKYLMCFQQFLENVCVLESIPNTYLFFESINCSKCIFCFSF